MTAQALPVIEPEGLSFGYRPLRGSRYYRVMIWRNGDIVAQSDELTTLREYRAFGVSIPNRVQTRRWPKPDGRISGVLTVRWPDSAVSSVWFANYNVMLCWLKTTGWPKPELA